ncbi:type IV toxin-antitoxin system AbiEi family antitoxin [Thiohalorhabdus methylotrophus]|uniref:Type IV toxin-antitoxin system AbiEi family antitoxin n=1 Tax=Thiohalorhabdus methylotrophus TaxID=3242694 RepID=A0ABV4TSM8_9GAMM
MEPNKTLEQALAALEKTAGLAAEHEAGAPEPEVRLAGTVYRVRLSGELAPRNLEKVVTESAPEELLVAERVTPKAAEILRERGIHFLDQAGNAFLQGPELYVFVSGQGRPAKRSTGPQIRAFRPKGLQVVFALLCREGLIHASYREIAEYAQVALGTVTGVIQDLDSLGYIRVGRSGRHWIDRQGLAEDWAKGFQRELRPRLNPRRYRVEDPEWWQDLDPREYGFRLGGEAGAARLTGYLRPERATLYGQGDFKALARTIRPVKDEAGNLEVLDSFWGPQASEDWGPVVHPLLLYAELVNDPADRLQEVAARIREGFLD